MSDFESTRGMMTQQHFTVVELTIPVVNGTCTISGEPGFGTPLSCDQPSNGEKTYKFCTANAPMLNGKGDIIYRCIKSISETPTKLQSGRGLASRGTVSISMIDFDKKDPNPLAPAVTQEVINTGFFLAKLDARNILVNRPLVIKNYRVQPDGSIDLVNGAESRNYLVESLEGDGKGGWSLKGKDELAKVNIENAVFPENLGGFLRQDIDDAVVDIPVDANVTYAANNIVLIGEEFMDVFSVSGIGTGSAELNVRPRGLPIDRTVELTRTTKDEHDAGDEVFLCEFADNERIDTVLERILLYIDIPPSFIPAAQWAEEIDEWHPLTRINTIWYEEESAGDALEKILTDYMIDMWFDPVDSLIKISAVSVWKESTAQLSENVEIDFGTIRKKNEESLRATSALAVYDKRFLATSDSIENYKKASQFVRTDLEGSDFYGEPKRKQFDFSNLLDKNAADLLVQRYVARYSFPVSYKWKTQESKLNFKTGDVVDISSSVSVDFSGAAASSSRAQITSIKPEYSDNGRMYSISALTYEAVFSEGSEIIISGTVGNINLYTQYAGAPSQAVELTFIFDAATVSSASISSAAVSAGAFPAGSKLIIIMVNGSKWQGRGGDGGRGDFWSYEGEVNKWLRFHGPGDGDNGGIVFDAQGVDCDMYFSGATPSGTYPTADGFIFAPNGGDGGFSSNPSPNNPSAQIPSNGGNGGNGSSVGLGGGAGRLEWGAGTNVGDVGDSGNENASHLDLGKSGNNNNATGGLAGSGVIDGGGTVNFFGSSATRYVNGNGDH